MAAAVADAGIDPVAFLTAPAFEASVMQAIAVAHAHDRADHDEQLAIRIAHNVSRVFGGK